MRHTNILSPKMGEASINVTGFRLSVRNAFVTPSLKIQDGGFEPYSHQSYVIICIKSV